MSKILYLAMFLTTLSCSMADAIKAPCRDTNCSNYTSQSDAQADFNLNPDCRNDLDADKDGIACEEPGNTVKTCASTSNCGCSNKTKSQCESDACCKWIVGTGCKCR